MAEYARDKEVFKMDRDYVLQSIILKKRFCKDCNIPISVYDNPYFYQRLCALEPIYHGIERFKTFCDELAEYDNEQDYFEYYNAVKDKVITAIKENPAYQEFNSEIFTASTPFNKRNLYIDDNDGKAFISIDMKKANFSALQFYDPDIFDYCSTWEEFIGLFTDNEHIINSKYIRQVIFGACNPGHQVKYERYLMAKLANHITVNLGNAPVLSLGEDEIILRVVPHCGYSLNEVKEVVKSCPDHIGNLVRVEMFNLYKIPGTTGWTKHNYDGTVEFKCLNGDTIHQVVKHYSGEPITKDDLVFFHDGKLATYLEAIENPWR